MVGEHMNDQKIALFTDTGNNTPADVIAAHDIRVAPLRIAFSDGTAYESGVDIDAPQLVARLADDEWEQLREEARKNAAEKRSKRVSDAVNAF